MPRTELQEIQLKMNQTTDDVRKFLDFVRFRISNHVYLFMSSSTENGKNSRPTCGDDLHIPVCVVKMYNFLFKVDF